MPIAGYMSLCKERAPIISSRDKGGSQTHIAYNRGSSVVTHYQVDGVIIKSGNKCDFLLINEDKKTAYLIELKGSDLSWAAMQLQATEQTLSAQLAPYQPLQYRIVANKCRTNEIETAEFKKYRKLWKNRLVYKSVKYEEKI